MVRWVSAGSVLILSVFTVTGSAQVVMVNEGDACHFLRGAAPPPPDWADAAFDPVAAGWETGPTGIGYGDDDDATVLEDMLDAYFSVYLRIAFEVPAGVEDFIGLLSVRYDDGFVSYIDGQEVARRNLLGVPPAFDEPAEPDHEIIDPLGFDELIALESTAGLLAPGQHVLAVEVHNATIDSSDLSFAAQLSARPFIVTSVAPPIGPLEGGGSVSVFGRGFDPADWTTEVRFGGVPSPDVLALSSEELDVVVPPGTVEGYVTVEVEDARGVFALPDAYRYAGPGQTGLGFSGGQFATADGLGEVSDAGSFEIWFRRTGFGFRSGVLLAVEAPGGGDALRVESRRGSQIRVRSGVGDEQETLEAQGPFGGGWLHLAVTFSLLGRRIYLNGELAASDSVVMALSAGARLRFGASFEGELSGFSGQIQSARVWASELTPAEIRRRRFATLEPGTGFEAAWPMDEGFGQVAYDTGPSGLDLTLGETSVEDPTDPEWIELEDFPQLALADIEPNSGPRAGGNSVMLYGGGFSSASPPVVRFGTEVSPTVDVHSTWELEVVVPPAAAYGTVDVSVETPQGTVSLPAAYAYMPGDVRAFVSEGELWDYFVGAAAPPADWTSLAFDPGAWDWDRGPTGIGYGDEDDATDVSEMIDAYVTVYARREWLVTADVSAIDYLMLRVRYDDGYVAYLNGEEIARSNLQGAPPDVNEFAEPQHEITGGPGEFDEEIDLMPVRHFLRSGENVLALEVHNATIDSSDLSLSAELVYALSGPVEEGPEIAVAPLSLDFGDILEGTSDAREITIENVGTADLAVTDVALAAGTSADFAITSEPTSATLEPGGRLTVEVTYSPSDVGADSGAVVIQSDDADEPEVNVSLAGTGQGVPEVEVSPLSLDFGEVHVGESGTLTILIESTGSIALDVTNIALVGGSSEDFAITSGPASATLNPGESVTVDIAYSPSDMGPDSGTAIIQCNDTDEPEVTIALAGTGVPPRISYIRGDANADGHVDLADPIRILFYLFSNEALSCLSAADTNDDDSVNASDGVYLLTHLFMVGPPPPSPYGACGVEPVDDGLTCESFPPCN